MSNKFNVVKNSKHSFDSHTRFESICDANNGMKKKINRDTIAYEAWVAPAQFSRGDNTFLTLITMINVFFSFFVFRYKFIHNSI